MNSSVQSKQIRINKKIFSIWLLNCLAIIAIISALVSALAQTHFRYTITQANLSQCEKQNLQPTTLLRLIYNRNYEVAFICLLSIQLLFQLPLGVALFRVLWTGQYFTCFISLFFQAVCCFSLWLNLICFGNIVRAIVDFRNAQSCIDKTLVGYKSGLYLTLAFLCISIVSMLLQLFGYIAFGGTCSCKARMYQQTEISNSQEGVAFNIPEERQAREQQRQKSFFNRVVTASKNVGSFSKSRIESSDQLNADSSIKLRDNYYQKSAFGTPKLSQDQKLRKNLNEIVERSAMIQDHQKSQQFNYRISEKRDQNSINPHFGISKPFQGRKRKNIFESGEKPLNVEDQGRLLQSDALSHLKDGQVDRQLKSKNDFAH